jgi:hypothetical protein
MNGSFRSLTTFLLLTALTMAMVLTGCVANDALDLVTPSLTHDASTAESTSASSCSVTEPVWVKPPDDSAVQSSPTHGYYFVNQDASIWASAWWVVQKEYSLHSGKEGNKVGWFRPSGTTLEITGQRRDAPAPRLEADIPCCYPTRFQATGLMFPTEGCWEVTARAADSELTFVVWVEP